MLSTQRQCADVVDAGGQCADVVDAGGSVLMLSMQGQCADVVDAMSTRCRRSGRVLGPYSTSCRYRLFHFILLLLLFFFPKENIL